jgi:hypothetical protein
MAVKVQRQFGAKNLIFGAIGFLVIGMIFAGASYLNKGSADKFINEGQKFTVTIYKKESEKDHVTRSTTSERNTIYFRLDDNKTGLTSNGVSTEEYNSIDVDERIDVYMLRQYGGEDYMLKTTAERLSASGTQTAIISGGVFTALAVICLAAAGFMTFKNKSASQQ